MNETSYWVIFEKGPTSWGAYVPDLPGCVAVADTREEAERLIQEAIKFHIEGLQLQGISAPIPVSEVSQVRIAVQPAQAIAA